MDLKQRAQLVRELRMEAKGNLPPGTRKRMVAATRRAAVEQAEMADFSDSDVGRNLQKPAQRQLLTNDQTAWQFSGRKRRARTDPRERRFPNLRRLRQDAVRDMAYDWSR